MLLAFGRSTNSVERHVESMKAARSHLIVGFDGISWGVEQVGCEVMVDEGFMLRLEVETLL